MNFDIRQGQTNLNIKGRLQGRSGLQLNENGISQAKHLKDQFGNFQFDYVFSSPRVRIKPHSIFKTAKNFIKAIKFERFYCLEKDR